MDFLNGVIGHVVIHALSASEKRFLEFVTWLDLRECGMEVESIRVFVNGKVEGKLFLSVDD